MEQIYKIQKRSKEGYYKIRHVAAEINLLMTEAALQRKSQQENGGGKVDEKSEKIMHDAGRIKKIMDLFAGHDLKFDRETRIKRQGTPVHRMNATELPSPVASKNSKNMASFPTDEASGESPE